MFYNPRKSYKIVCRTSVAHQRKGLYMTPNRRAEGGGGYGRRAKGFQIVDAGTRQIQTYRKRISAVGQRYSTGGAGWHRSWQGFSRWARRSVPRQKGGTKPICSGLDAWQSDTRQRMLSPLRAHAVFYCKHHATLIPSNSSPKTRCEAKRVLSKIGLWDVSLLSPA